MIEPARPLPGWAAELPAFPPRSIRAVLEDEPVEIDHPEVRKLAQVEDHLGYAFRDRRLLRCALTTRGWVNEHQASGWPDNKALEWLGDAVLYLVVTEDLVRSGAAARTGTSTPKRVEHIENRRLAELGEALELWDALNLGDGEWKENVTTGRERFLACAVEAVLGAVYLDAGAAGDDPLAAVAALLDRHLLDEL